MLVQKTMIVQLFEDDWHYSICTLSVYLCFLHACYIFLLAYYAKYVYEAHLVWEMWCLKWEQHKHRISTFAVFIDQLNRSVLVQVGGVGTLSVQLKHRTLVVIQIKSFDFLNFPTSTRDRAPFNLTGLLWFFSDCNGWMAMNVHVLYNAFHKILA